MADQSKDLGRVSRESNTQKTARAGGTKVAMKPGPAAGRRGSPNPVRGGGINRATRGHGGSSMQD